MILIKGGEIKNLYKALIFDDGLNYTSKYVQKTLDIKNEGIKNKNKGMKSFGKLLGNSFYG